MAQQKKNYLNKKGDDAEYGKQLEERIRKARKHMDSMPTELPSATVAFGHIPNTIDSSQYDKIPTRLPDPAKHFACIPTNLKWVDKIRTG